MATDRGFTPGDHEAARWCSEHGQADLRGRALCLDRHHRLHGTTQRFRGRADQALAAYVQLACGGGDAAREVGAALEVRVRTIDRARLLHVERLACRHPGCLVDEEHTAYAFIACERVRACAPKFSGPDDANGRHESVEYSSWTAMRLGVRMLHPGSLA